MGPSSSPWSVSALQVERLGNRFTPFINLLLETECAAAGLEGRRVTTPTKENVGDEGVDAAVEGSIGSEWIPDGSSAWQFKAGDCEPSKCRRELEGAGWAHQYLRNGGSYRLVLGAELTDAKEKRRRAALRETAIDLGLISAGDEDRIDVYPAAKLARWASTHPSLALSPLVDGLDSSAVHFDRWSAERAHSTPWKPDAARLEALDAIRANLRSRQDALRVTGNPGYGKTRLVLEALRESEFSDVVVYVNDESRLSQGVINQLLSFERGGIIVLDECDAERHTKVAGQIPVDSPLLLVTIGNPGLVAQTAAEIRVDRLSEEQVADLLQEQFGDIGVEATQFVIAHSGGNPRWAMHMAERIRRSPADAAELITADDIEEFVTRMLPEGRRFFISTYVALLTQLGYVGDLRAESSVLGSFAGAGDREIDAAVAALEANGLIARRGRYVSIEPHPLAVYLASIAWRRDGSRIVSDLLPVLADDMRARLFERLSHLGRVGEARQSLERLLDRDGPYGSLARIENEMSGRQLTQLAIVMPEQMADHIGRMVKQASIDELRGWTRSRRDLVWALEKLAWHRSSFERAADALLRLAEAENESYANNATGTWLGLFGVLLPTTAASPPQRLKYLAGLSAEPESFAGQMVLRAATGVLEAGGRESVSVSAERQGGAAVEARGGARTHAEASAYLAEMLALLGRMLKSAPTGSVDRIGEAHAQVVHSVARGLLPLEQYVEQIQRLPVEYRRLLRAECRRLQRVYGGSDEDRSETLERLRIVLESIPAADSAEELRTLALLNRWEARDGELRDEGVGILTSLGRDEALPIVAEVLSEDPTRQSAWDVGWAAGSAFGRLQSYERLMLELVSESTGPLLGYLWGAYDAGDRSAFEELLADARAAGELTARQALDLCSRAPASPRTRELMLELLGEVEVGAAARGAMLWRDDLPAADARRLLEGRWLPTIESVADYRAVIDWADRYVRSGSASGELLDGALHQLVMARRHFPNLGNDAWTWSELVERSIPNHPADIAELILGLVASGDVYIHATDREAEVLSRCAAEDPPLVMAVIGEALLGEASWRFQISASGWLFDGVPPDVVGDWIGDDVERARIASRIVSVGGESPSELVRYLLVRFGEDDEVAAGLLGRIMTGSWMGNESDRIRSLVDGLSGWMDDTEEAVREFAARASSLLRQRLEVALLEEAEEEL